MHRTARPSTARDIRDFVEKVGRAVIEAGGRDDIDTFICPVRHPRRVQ
jgi:hypothetical protein